MTDSQEYCSKCQKLTRHEITWRETNVVRVTYHTCAACHTLNSTERQWKVKK